MKCPECGKWNRATFPTCQYCGAKLEYDNEEPEWRKALKDDQKGKEYIRVDEEGEAEATPDPRDTLAREMAELKLRKAAGSRMQRKMREEGAERGSAPSGMTVQTEHRGSTFWDFSDDPSTTLHETHRHRHSQDKTGTGKTYRVNSGTDEFSASSRSYEPMWNESEMSASWQLPQLPTDKHLTTKLPSRRRGMRHIITALIVLLCVSVVSLGVYLGVQLYSGHQQAVKEKNAAIVTASMKNDLAAHTIMIPGEDGQQIYISELHTSYIVSGGFATIVVEDHTWYENLETLLDETMTVTLTPYLKTASGKQQPLDPITYDINIPLSPITLVTPSADWVEVSTAMYTIELTVRPGSKVTINGEDFSDIVNNETGTFSYNATVQPNGDNEFLIKCRSQYCRESEMTVTLYRAPQEISLDLSPDTPNSTNDASPLIVCSTVPKATVNVLTPHSDLNITYVDSTGEFSFYAMFDHIGYNTITITAEMPGKKTSVVNHEVYYVPDRPTYTTKAWPTSEAEYAELLSNLQMRADRQQVYVVKGELAYFVSEKPQMAVFYCDQEGQTRPVLLENFSSITWKEDTYYRIYADVYGSYNGMPWLCARYTYDY